MSGGDDDRWVRYYDAVVDRPPRDTLVRALAAIAAEGGPPKGALALDLGAGEGRDTVELLRRGYSVVAIDAEPRAFERLRARPDLTPGAVLDTRVVRFEDAKLPPADLINASFSLPFCAPERFVAFWQNLLAALKPGARFAGHLLGTRDAWATDPEVTALEPEAARALLAGLAVEYFWEEETDSSTATGRPKHWHLFHVVARKGGRSGDL